MELAAKSGSLSDNEEQSTLLYLFKFHVHHIQ